MQPIRGNRNRDVAVDWTDREHTIAQNEEGHFLSDVGALESTGTKRAHVLACGCVNKPVGNFCAECSRPVCVTCAGVCMDGQCNKPICPRHSRIVRDCNGSTLRFCAACFGYRSRKRVVGSIFRAIVSPFINFNDDHDQT